MYTRGSARALRIHSQRERAASAVHCVATRRRRSADGEDGRRDRTALFEHGDPTEDAALHALLRDDATCAPPPRRSCWGRRRESRAPTCMCVPTACPLVHRRCDVMWFAARSQKQREMLCDRRCLLSELLWQHVQTVDRKPSLSLTPQHSVGTKRLVK